MIGSRTRPLLLAAAAGGALLVARLYEVQVVEHELWAREAARLVHSGELLPAERGRILDAAGRVLARDKETYSLALLYREFRRGHPLGQVAHARSLLEERAVPLAEARGHLLAWAEELVTLRPAALAAFARGEPLLHGTLRLPATPREELAHRARRVADVRFYVRGLLELELGPWKRLLERAAEHEELSFLELAALERGPGGAAAPESAETRRARLADRLVRSMDQLGRLAGLLEAGAAEEDPLLPATPLERLVAELEEARRWVEDASASKLFAEATGFAPGRAEPRTLLELVDLEWLRRLFAWDEARLEDWARESRRAWLQSWRAEYALPRLVASLGLDPSREPGPDDVLDRAAALFGPGQAVERALDGQPTPWREVEDLAVFAELPHLFTVAPDPATLPALRAVLPFQTAEARAMRPAEDRAWTAIDRVRSVLPETPTMGPALGRLLARGGRRGLEEAGEIVADLVADWDRVFQAELRVRLAELAREGAAGGELSPAGRLVLGQGRRTRALERADFFLKDYGMRPRMLQRREPDYATVFLLDRYQEWYPGFVAEESRQRVYPVLEGDAARLAGALIGDVSAYDVYDLQRQRGARRRLRELRNAPDRSPQEDVELTELVGSVVIGDEKRGVSGVEGYWDEELTGRNGFRESWGLEDAFGTAGRGRSPVREPVDGADVWLTLDAELQRAAERTLREPQLPDDPVRDEQWHAAPVGAIVLLTPQGDVLAAASEPNEASLLDPDVSGQRAVLIDRALRRPTFQPPGSVFKPFVAAYALEELGLDPAWTVVCGPIERGGAGYVDVRCHSRAGHGEVDLEQALVQSCNAYFAALGERLPLRGFHELSLAFGFEDPTGVRTPPPWSPVRERDGLAEEPGGLDVGRSGGWRPTMHRLAGNGLASVQATPMQVARATAGLATGSLPQVRLVARIGDREVPPGPRRALPIAAAHLARVRASLERVASSPLGSAHAALGPARLGYEVAVKTGSADLTSRRDGDADYKARKHTWVAGWLPPEDPVAVFVVFVHDTSVTSSHGAVYVARQLLRQPELETWLAERGVALEAQR